MMIKAKNLYYKIPAGQYIYEGLNFELYEGDFFGVLGRNGAGKTTLIDLLNGYRNISDGELLVMGENPMANKRRNKRKIFNLAHDIQIQPSHRVENYLEFTSFFYPEYDKVLEMQLLEFFQIDPKSKFGALSTGQKVKAQIVAAVSSRPRLLLIDEVTAVLDPESREKFFTLLKKMKREGNTAVVMATNIAQDLELVVDKVLFIDNKKARVYDINQVASLFNTNVVFGDGNGEQKKVA